MKKMNDDKINNLYDELSLLDVTNIFYELDNIRLNAEIGIRTALAKCLNSERLFPWDYKNIYKFCKGIEIIESDQNSVSSLEVVCLLNMIDNYSDMEIDFLKSVYCQNADIMQSFEEGNKQRVRRS